MYQENYKNDYLNIHDMNFIQNLSPMEIISCLSLFKFLELETDQEQIQDLQIRICKEIKIKNINKDNYFSSITPKLEKYKSYYTHTLFENSLN